MTFALNGGHPRISDLGCATADVKYRVHGGEATWDRGLAELIPMSLVATETPVNHLQIRAGRQLAEQHGLTAIVSVTLQEVHDGKLAFVQDHLAVDQV